MFVVIAIDRLMDAPTDGAKIKNVVVVAIIVVVVAISGTMS